MELLVLGGDDDRKATARTWRAVVTRLLLLGVVAAVPLTLVAVHVGRQSLSLLSRAVPDVPPVDLHEAAQVQRSQPSVVLASDGTVLGRFLPEELHDPVRTEQIPETVRAAVIAAEDERFLEHQGVDVRAVVRAFVANVQSGGVEQGGSTITQQLAKMLFTDGEQRLRRKIEEARIALALEERHTKDEILTAYLNHAYFGEGAIGIGAAARTYFRKPVSQLTLGEAALLAAVIPAPTAYNPRTAPEVAEARRRLVLDQVAEAGLARADDIAAARARPPVVHPPRPRVEAFPYYMDFVRRWLLDELGVAPQLLYGGGLRVETSLDPVVQAAAKQAVASRLAPPGPAGAVVTLDPRSGAVLALVGGRSWDRSQVNLALGRFGGGTGRQPGSSFKPIVLATAYEEGMSPRDVLPAPEEYRPAGAEEPVRNYSRRGYGRLTVAEATWRSVNTAYAALTERLGPDRVAETARRLGVTTLPEDVGVSIGLGAYEVSPLEMAAAYAAFANGGREVRPSPVARVVAPDGTVVAQARGGELGGPAVSPETAALVTATLSGVIDHGTGRAAQLDRPAAGKTGTSDRHTDAWFVGYTPQRVTAVWVGHPAGAVPMPGVAGGTLPAPLWRDVMLAAHAGLPVEPFPPAPVRPRTTTTTATTAPTTTATTPTTTTTTVPLPPTTTTRPPTTTTRPPTTTTTTAPPTTTTTTAPTTTTTTTAPTTTTTTATTQPTTTTTTTAPPTTTTTTTTTAPTTSSSSTTAPEEDEGG